MLSPRRILVVRTDRIGDVILATPLIRAIRKTFPGAVLAALVRPYTRDVLLGNPHLDEILVDDADGEHAGRNGFWKLVRSIRERRFDTALLLLPTERLAWALLAAGIRTRVGVGWKLYQVLSLMRSVSRHKYIPLRHEADYCLDLGRLIGVRDDGLAVEVFLTPEERGRGREVLRKAGIPLERDGSRCHVIIIHPGSRSSSPNWRVERYAELALLCLKKPDMWVVITGTKDEKEFSEHFKALEQRRVVDLIGQHTLRETMGVIAAGSVLVSASTGPMHIAAGLGIPTVSMFCPLTACSPVLWGPLGNRSEVVLPPKGYCQHECPGDPHVCQFEGGIFPEEVYQRIRGILNLPPDI